MCRAGCRSGLRWSASGISAKPEGARSAGASPQKRWKLTISRARCGQGRVGHGVPAITGRATTCRRTPVPRPSCGPRFWNATRGALRRRTGPPRRCSSPKDPVAAVGFVEPADHALGRSRGGLSSKVHLCCDGRGLPLRLTLTAGQAGDNPQLLAVPDAISVHTGRPGRPRRRPERLLADKAYSHPSTRAALRARGIKATIPERDDQLARRRYLDVASFTASMRSRSSSNASNGARSLGDSASRSV